MKTAQHVSPDVKRLLAELRRRLDALYGARLHSVVLYGSHARGEAHADSDVDVMVVLRGEVDAYAEIERLSEPVYAVQLTFGKWITTYPVSLHRYETSAMPVLINARREGVSA